MGEAAAGARQRSVGRHPVTIGVSSRGRDIEQLDLDAVRAGTGARVVPLDQERNPEHYRQRGIELNGVFVPGGMLNLPGTVTGAGDLVSPDGGGDPAAPRDPDHEPRSPEQAVAWNQRTAFQAALIAQARDGTLPILGVCGGSRCMAQHALRPGEGRGETYLLPEQEASLAQAKGRRSPVPYFVEQQRASGAAPAQKHHNQYYGEPWRIAHDVHVDPESDLGRIIRGEHWRQAIRPAAAAATAGGAAAARGPGSDSDSEDRSAGPASGAGAAAAAAAAAPPPSTIPVNSMHWAAARFHQPSGGPIRESAHDPEDRVVEGWQRTGHPFFHGVQWHPEFAQLPLGHFAHEPHQPHARIMGALGLAATEDQAAKMIQRQARVHLLRLRLRRRAAARRSGSPGGSASSE